MESYSTHDEASRILHELLLAVPALGLPSSIQQAATKIRFTGSTKPFVPSPLKMTESSVSLTALVAAAASVIAAERYDIGYQDIEINTDIATLFLESVLLPTIKGESFMKHTGMMGALKTLDLHDMSTPLRRAATNVYRTKDGRWYHLHGSMNSTPTMEMLGVTAQDVSYEEAIKIYTEKLAQWTAAEIEKTANEQYRQAGVLCYTPDEFFASEQGKIMGNEPLWSSTTIASPRKPWPKAAAAEDNKPLAGIKVLDLSRVIAAPAVSKILAVLGADVLRVSHKENPDYAATMIDLQTGKRDVNINIKSQEGRETLTKLLKDADVVVNGFRPGALEKMGFGSASLRELNPSVIYVRECCYGFKGPLAYRSGWQQISDCLVGISYLQGKFLGLDEAVVPLFPNSDYQTGLVGAAAVLQALLTRATEDKTFDIDISLTQYNIWYYRLGLYSEAQQKELRAQDPDFMVHHDDDMGSLVAKTHQSLLKVRPDLVKPEYFWDMDGSEWGIDSSIKILAPAFKLAKSKMEYTVPSGCRGRSKPEWLKA